MNSMPNWIIAAIIIGLGYVFRNELADIAGDVIAFAAVLAFGHR